jgi:hypothetical protein
MPKNQVKSAILNIIIIIVSAEAWPGFLILEQILIEIALGWTVEILVYGYVLVLFAMLVCSIIPGFTI